MSQLSEQRRHRKTGFSPEEIREVDADAFYANLAFQNITRMRMMSMVALAIFLPLFIWDLIRFFHGYWQQSIGYPIIAFSHLGLLFFLAVILLLVRRKMPEGPASVQASHKRFINGALAIALLFTLPLVLGDISGQRCHRRLYRDNFCVRLHIRVAQSDQADPVWDLHDRNGASVDRRVSCA